MTMKADGGTDPTEPARRPSPASTFDPAAPLASLPADALLSVLCRVPASDHASLRKTCRAVRRALDSDAFASERAATGWAEVSARLVPGEELYDREYPDGFDDTDVYLTDDEGERVRYDPDEHDCDDEDMTEEERAEARARRGRYEEKLRARREEDLDEHFSELGSKDEYGVIDITVDITIDGTVAGCIQLILVSRPRFGDMFHERTDGHSQELQEVGCTLCDRWGRPTNRTIKEADVDRSARRGGFLHVKKVSVPQAYRPSDSTNVVAESVRAALTVPELSGRWTLATAISDSRLYMTEEEKRRRDAWLNSDRGDAEDDAARAEETNILVKRKSECMMLDARTFLRVGYRQIPEVVGAERNAPPWFFALPRYFLDPVLSHEEAAAIKMHLPPDLPPDPTEADKELLELVKRASNQRKKDAEAAAGLDRSLGEVESSVRAEDEQMATFAGQLRELESMMADMEAITDGQMVESVRSRIAGMQSTLDSHRDAAASARRRMDSMSFEERCDKKRTEIRNVRENLRSKMAANREDLRARATALVDGKGASVRRGFALHCAARLLALEYFDLLLGLVPGHERSAAVDDVDAGGCTPLHCSLMGTPELSDKDLYYDVATHLVGLGASRDAVDPSGRTPLGQYRLVRTSRNNFTTWLGGASQEQGENDDAWQSFHQRMEEVLKPVLGETDAGKDAGGDQSSDESSMDDDDESFTEEEQRIILGFASEEEDE